MFQQWSRGAGGVALVALLAGLVCLLAACGEEGVEEQQVPKGAEAIPQAPAAGPGGAEPPAASPPGPGDDQSSGADPAQSGETPWVAPVGWTIVPGERPMRLATFEAPDESGPVEVAVTRFPGRVGGELANINRWRGQTGLPALDAGELESSIERFEAPGYEGYQVRIAGVDTHMLAAGVYEIDQDRTWFVRATAAPEVAGRLEADVFDFARSIAGLAPAGGG